MKSGTVWTNCGLDFGRDPRSSNSLRGIVFPKKIKNCSHNFHVLRLQAVITLQWLQIAGNSLPNCPSTGCLVSIFTVRINSVFPLDCTFRTKKVLTQILGNVRCPILRIKTNITPQCRCGLASDILKKSRLNWKLKISNAADNAGITQSQARDTRYRWMQELNRLCVIQLQNDCHR